jgi:spermidine synthase
MLGTKILEERRSKFNGNLRVVRSFGLGTYIQADGLTQSGGIVEGIWKQTLKKVKSEKLKVKSCLILGLGGGTVAKLIRKNWPEAKITGVDIDPVMVELGIKYLALDTSKAEIVIQDAFDYYLVPNAYDLVIIDLYQGDQFPKKFESEDYIHLVRHGLASKGVAIFNRLYFKDKKKDAKDFGGKLKKIFKKVDYFYPITNIMFVCSK